ncbi:DNA polymerase I [Lactobacillus acetotolerans]|jgi:DNA polymerase-1|uniref:DNA polymerase I n=2 Tax=Lactobacillus acetotolerans TaxID=1600 RepID=A0A5P5ZI58_9LACO|nr:DNA polymerase I [Lactobacillus acetotolerans]KRN39957.1 DNA polymerase I [Lactobacillus acetotolerans DSM 20749 = JCM 3825]MBN7276360.1 DNA polymerase I [Lactobacillus acetotolerans]QFG51000.1 DNA polymerase I [Lactobacillus acetotolerans]QGV04891.1 DNA polymerase I [Lactobacillus acetotolerans]QJD73794.1 DNA polymerase I [Lactobacillus acetotolerans]
MADKKLLLIDGNSVAFRAFYALYRQLESFKNPEGLHTNAIYAFKNMLDVLLKDVKPTHVLVAFDAGKVTFRNKMYDDYKGGRQKTPEELLEQLPYIQEMLHDLGIKTYELKNYEADDIIGTFVNLGEKADFKVTVVTGDRDLTQLTSNKTTVMVTKHGVSDLEAYTPEHMKKINGVTPTEFIDMKALMGDNSDNYPGVTKIGPKTASNLIQKYGSIENLYDHIDDMKKSKRKENLIKDKDKAFLAKKLATIDRNAPVTIGLKDVKCKPVDYKKLRQFYEQMNFRKFLGELNASGEGQDGAEVEKVKYTELDQSNAKKISVKENDTVSFYLGMLGDNYHLADFVGFALKINEQVYVSRDVSLLQENNLKHLLEDAEINKNVFDLKRTTVGLNRIDVHAHGLNYDMLLASYLINNENNSNDVGEVCHLYGDYSVKTDLEVYGKGKSEHVPSDDKVLYNHLASKVVAIEKLKPLLLKKLKEHEQDDLFENIEIPTARVLSTMEISGIKVEASTLIQLQNEFAVRLKELEDKIYQQAGERFNLNSPKQLGHILFDKLGLPPLKKTKTGYSTSVEVLNQLRNQSPIVGEILDYRQIAKIQSTYVKGLLDVIQPDGRVHTRYLQTLTATGRLSSVDPNLQNIPTRTDEGKQIRKAFVPTEKDGYILSCDYSQIELRVLSQISGDEHMQEAFNTGYDIHSHTAMKIFHLDSPKDVTSLMRRRAKTVNFGIVYGISDYGLSKRLNISRKQAKEFIAEYFTQYPQVKDYMDKAVQVARDKGYAETIMHRRRYLPDIHSKNHNVRAFAERTAINSPIQGSAADIIKIAMINMQKKLDELHLKTKMVIQVHDELIFDVPKDELETVKKIVPEVMQSAVKLDVPLVADTGWGHNWYDAK